MPPKKARLKIKKNTPKKRGPKPGFRRKVGDKKKSEDRGLLKKVVDRNPFCLPRDQRIQAWEVVAADFNSEDNPKTERDGKYCKKESRNFRIPSMRLSTKCR